MPVLVGGDHFRWFRFYQSIWPLMVLPLYKICALVLEMFQLRSATITSNSLLKYLTTCFLFVCFFLGAKPSWYDFTSPNISHEGRIASRGRKTGEVLSNFFNVSSLPTVGVVSSGGIKYTYDGIVYDLMGLNNVAIAHQLDDRYGIRNHAAFSKKIFYQLNPHILLPMVLDKLPIGSSYNKRWHDTVLKGLFDDEEFKARYTCVSVKNSNALESVYLCGYFRNDFLQYLKTENVYSVSILEN